MRYDPDWVRAYHPKPDAQMRLVCLPHAGGSASFFRPLSAAAPDDVEVLAVQYPGRQDRYGQPAVERMDVLADHVRAALPGVADRPVAYLGHSMGAVLAFEMARRDGVAAPDLLVVSGRRAPSLVRAEAVHRLPDAGITAELQILGGTAATWLNDPELRALMLPAIRSDYAAVERYRCPPGASVPSPMLALVADDDPRVSIADVRAWADYTTGSFSLRVFRGGGHFFSLHTRPRSPPCWCGRSERCFLPDHCAR